MSLFQLYQWRRNRYYTINMSWQLNIVYMWRGWNLQQKMKLLDAVIVWHAYPIRVLVLFLLSISVCTKTQLLTLCIACLSAGVYNICNAQVGDSSKQTIWKWGAQRSGNPNVMETCFVAK